MKIRSFVILSVLSLFVRAQDGNQLINDLVKEDSAAITALALYPENVRKSILEACSYPEALVRMEALQKSTSESFRKLVQNYSKEEQQKTWDLSRYPGLISILVQNGKKSKEELGRSVQEYPEEIRQTAVDYALSHYQLLEKINSLNAGSDLAFESIITGYSPQAKASFREMVKYPELMKILSADMKMTVLVGDIYKKQSQLIERKLDSINTEHARQNAIDLEEWKAGLEKDPEAKKELEAASKEFAREQGYTDDDLEVRHETVIVNYVVHPYPYWYGYPWWYDYPYWYPYPYWYDWGFYYGPYGMVYLGYPSPFFVHWYFHHPHHHYHYNHFSNYCVDHYYGPRRSVSGFHREVSRWVRSTEKSVPKNFFANDVKRPERIKELGRFEMEFDKQVKADPSKSISRTDYLKENSSAYPHISPVLSESGPRPVSPVIYDKPKQPPVYKEQPRQKPTIIMPRNKPLDPTPVPRAKPVPSQPVKPAPPPMKKSQPRTAQMPAEGSTTGDNFLKINEAHNYHRSGWNGE